MLFQSQISQISQIVGTLLPQTVIMLKIALQYHFLRVRKSKKNEEQQPGEF